MRNVFGLLCLLRSAMAQFSREIIADGVSPLLIYPSNAGMLAVYSFRFSFSFSFASQMKLRILLPPEKYSLGLGGDFLPDFWLQVAGAQKIALVVEAVEATELVIALPPILASSEILLEVGGLRNPFESGGTGMFSVSVTVGSVTIAKNDHFANIGISPFPYQLSSAEVSFASGYTDSAGQLSALQLTIRPSTDLPSEFEVQLSMPDGFSLDGLSERLENYPHESVCGGGTVDVTCRVVSLSPPKVAALYSGAPIGKSSTISFEVWGVVNPPRAIDSPFFAVGVVAPGSPSLIEWAEPLAGPTVAPGPVADATLISENLAPVVPGGASVLILNFSPTNPCDEIEIVTRLKEVSSCFVRGGLIPVSVLSPVICSVSANIIRLSGFIQFRKQGRISTDTVEVRLLGTAPLRSGLAPPVEIYTRLASHLVDRSLSAKATSMPVIPAPPLQPDTTLSPSSSSPGALLSLSGFVVPLTNYTSADSPSLRLAFPSGFVLGSEGAPVTCQFEVYYEYLSSPGVVGSVTQGGSVPCAAENAAPTALRIDLESAGLPVFRTSPAVVGVLNLYNQLTVAGVRLPVAGGAYEATLTLISGGSVKEMFRASVPVAPPSFGASVVASAKVQTAVTLYTIRLTPPFELAESSQSLVNYYGSFVRIRVLFPQKIGVADVWDYRLGYTTVSQAAEVDCWFADSLVPRRGGARCTLTPGRDPLAFTVSAADFVQLDITNFKTVPASSALTFSFFAAAPGHAAPTVTLSLVLSQQGESTVLASSSLALGAHSAPAVPPAFPAFAASVAPSPAVSTTVTLNLDFNLGTPQLFAAGNYLAMELPRGLVAKTGTGGSSASFDGATMGKAYFLFSRSFGVAVLRPPADLTAGPHSITLTNFETAAEAAGVWVRLTFYSAGAAVNRGLTALGLASCAGLGATTIAVSYEASGVPGGQFSLGWTLPLAMNRSDIRVTFPAEIPLPVATPPGVSLWLNGTVVDESAVAVAVAGQGVEVSTPSLLVAKGTAVELRFQPVNNPAIAPGNLIVIVESEGYAESAGSFRSNVMCDTVGIPASLFPTGVSPFAAQIYTAEVWPTLGGVPASVSVTFSFSIDLFAEMIVFLRLPSLTIAGSTRATPECVAAELAPSSCEVLQTTPGVWEVKLELGLPLAANTRVGLDFLGLVLFDDPLASQTLGDFKVSATYGGVVVAESPTMPALAAPVLYPRASAGSLQWVRVGASPINAHEVGEYLFEFAVSGGIFDVGTGDELWIRFPETFALDLGPQGLQCESNLAGPLTCFASRRELRVRGLVAQSLVGTQRLWVFGVRSPTGETGDFDLALFDVAGATRLFATGITGPTTGETPLSAAVTARSTTSSYARTKGDFSMDLESPVSFPASSRPASVRIWVPSEYNMDPFEASCGAQPAFSLYSSCSTRFNLITIRSSNAEFDTSRLGPLKLKVAGLRAPETPGDSPHLLAMNWDDQNNFVLSRTFPNLSPLTFPFPLDGLELYINSNTPLRLEVGSFCDSIRISSAEPFKQTLSVQPISFDSAFIFDVNPVRLAKDSASAFFRLAAPQEMPLRRFYITFGKSGDYSLHLYATIRKLAVDVVASSTPRLVFVPSPLYANLQGLSLPLKFYTDHPPYEAVKISLQIASSWGGSATLSKNQLVISRFAAMDSFVISEIQPSPDDSPLEIELELLGPDSPSFTLSAPKITVPLQPLDPSPPELLELTLRQLNRTGAVYYVRADKLAYIYCVYGLLVALSAYAYAHLRQGQGPFDRFRVGRLSSFFCRWSCRRSGLRR